MVGKLYWIRCAATRHVELHMHIYCKTVMLTCSFVYIGHFDDLDCLSGATCARTKLLTAHTCDNPFCSPLMLTSRETCGMRDASSRLRQSRVLARFERFDLRTDSRFANEEDIGNVRHSIFLLCQPCFPTVSTRQEKPRILLRQHSFSKLGSCVADQLVLLSITYAPQQLLNWFLKIFELEVVVDGLPLWNGAQLAIDTTMVSQHSAAGTATTNGKDLEKTRRCPELSGENGRGPFGLSWARKWQQVVS